MTCVPFSCFFSAPNQSSHPITPNHTQSHPISPHTQSVLTPLRNCSISKANGCLKVRLRRRATFTPRNPSHNPTLQNSTQSPCIELGACMNNIHVRTNTPRYSLPTHVHSNITQKHTTHLSLTHPCRKSAHTLGMQEELIESPLLAYTEIGTHSTCHTKMLK